MQTTQMLINQHLMDINPILAGWVKDCNASPHWGNEPRYHMTIYYIQKGRFTLVTEKGSYPVREGQAFFIPLNDRTSYTVGEDDSYDFTWVGFNGTLSHRFVDAPTVLDIPENQLVHLKTLQNFGPHTAFNLAADLLLLRSMLFDGNEPKRDYVQHIIDYIQASYMHPITVESLAAQVGLDRSYLSRLFKEKVGQTLQDHLQYVRFHQAKTLLMQGCSVKEAAYKSGFSDIKNFHKVFVRREGLTPNQWKKCVLDNLATLRLDWPNSKSP